jgi:hypothetical protein
MWGSGIEGPVHHHRTIPWALERLPRSRRCRGRVSPTPAVLSHRLCDCWRAWCQDCDVRTAGSGFTVRTALPGDLLPVLGVHALRDADGRRPTGDSEIEIRTWAHMLEVPGLCVYLAEMDGDAVGTASSMIFPNITYACAPTAIIEAVVVAHSCRRQGVAMSLLHASWWTCGWRTATRFSFCRISGIRATGRTGSTHLSGSNLKPRGSVCISGRCPWP